MSDQKTNKYDIPMGVQLSHAQIMEMQRKQSLANTGQLDSLGPEKTSEPETFDRKAALKKLKDAGVTVGNATSDETLKAKLAELQ